MTSNRIMKIDEFEYSITYRASCDCSSKECDMILDIEVDKETEMLYLTIYKDLHWSSYWQTDNWFIEKWNRIKTAFRILFTGDIKVEEAFIMRDTQIDDFIKALEDGKGKLDEQKINQRHSTSNEVA